MRSQGCGSIRQAGRAGITLAKGLASSVGAMAMHALLDRVKRGARRGYDAVRTQRPESRTAFTRP